MGAGEGSATAPLIPNAPNTPAVARGPAAVPFADLAGRTTSPGR